LSGDWVATREFQDAGSRLRSARREQEETLLETLNWLWNVLARPVLRQLDMLDSAPEGSPPRRVWWCPIGSLTVLPLHAATDGSTRSADSVPYHVVSSYTPTISALLSARRATSHGFSASVDKLLLVSLPITPGEQPLPHTWQEAESIRSRLTPERVTVLQEEAATQQRVMDELAIHPWVHFGCHANQDLVNPSAAALSLYDGQLTVLDLARLRFDGEFAFLSACKTATGGVALTEEAMTMAAAMHYTGFRRVIATLWSVRDETAARIVDSVYAKLVQDGNFDPSFSAVALHGAIDEVRRAHPDRPSLWSPFVHIGL
jgi:CHAT domain-containing protein